MWSKPAIQSIQARLRPENSLKKYNFPKEAAVLIPLCVVSGVSSVLLTLRSPDLKSHSGQVSFPGGMRDTTDASLSHTALRETFEEIGLVSDAVQILGRMDPVPDRTGTILVHPFVGFLPDPLLPSSLHPNPEEVSRVFSMGVHALLESRLDCMEVLGNRWKVPSWHIDIDHQGIGSLSNASPIRLWGLSAYILNSFFEQTLVSLPKI